jgi:3',5'-nucleoside bisphosphate phosphatase
MLAVYRGDLHIHTCLSPCADLTMSPLRVVERAVDAHLDMIAICDHNSAENVRAAQAVAREKKITVLAGMEITSVEEVHLLALFDETGPVLKLQETVYQTLSPGENREEIFGQQIVANEWDEVEGFNPRLLIGATSLTLNELVETIHCLGGLAIASHIDREVFGIIGQLGFIPPDLDLDALEISARMKPETALQQFPGIEKFPLITSSDAHVLEEIGARASAFLLASPGVTELRRAFAGLEGRKVVREA